MNSTEGPAWDALVERVAEIHAEVQKASTERGELTKQVNEVAIIVREVIKPRLTLVDAHEVALQRATGSLKTIHMILAAIGVVLPVAGGIIGWLLHR